MKRYFGESHLHKIVSIYHSVILIGIEHGWCNEAKNMEFRIFSILKKSKDEVNI